MNVDVTELFKIIGKQTVTIEKLTALNAALVSKIEADQMEDTDAKEETAEN